jgi:glycosyltransferase involved in cell wall biosynthesis
VGESKRLAEITTGLDVEFIEWADDYVKAMNQSDIVLLPDSVGTGLKNRTIQALSLGIPTVGTAVAFEGIPVISGLDAMVSRSSSEMLDQLALLVRDQSRRKELGARGQLASRKQYSRQQVVELWQTRYRELVAKLQANPPESRLHHRTGFRTRQ